VRWSIIIDEDNDEKPLKIWCSGDYSVWHDRDIEHGEWAAAREHKRGSEIVGHAKTRRGAQTLCRQHEKK